MREKGLLTLGSALEQGWPPACGACFRASKGSPNMILATYLHVKFLQFNVVGVKLFLSVFP